METIKTHILKIFLILILGFHLGLHILYLAPVNPAFPHYSKFVNQYINTFFSQNWHLFAPEPATSTLNFLYRCDVEGDWKNPYLDLITAHKSFPFTSKGKEAYIYQHLAREIYNAKLKKIGEKDIQELTLVKKFLINNCPSLENSEIEIQRIFTNNYSKRFNPEKINSEKLALKFVGGNILWN